jgi:hypothetical protein
MSPALGVAVPDPLAATFAHVMIFAYQLLSSSFGVDGLGIGARFHCSHNMSWVAPYTVSRFDISLLLHVMRYVELG